MRAATFLLPAAACGGQLVDRSATFTGTFALRPSSPARTRCKAAPRASRPRPTLWSLPAADMSRPTPPPPPAAPSRWCAWGAGDARVPSNSPSTAAIMSPASSTAPHAPAWPWSSTPPSPALAPSAANPVLCSWNSDLSSREVSETSVYRGATST